MSGSEATWACARTCTDLCYPFAGEIGAYTTAPDCALAGTKPAAAQPVPSGSGISTLDTGRLKVDAPLLVSQLVAALRSADHTTTLVLGDSTTYTFGPPQFRDQRVCKYCELDYDEPRGMWI